MAVMPAEPVDRRARRHERKREQILAAAWELAHGDGIAGISLRELADLVDLRQPSLYAYFSSKHDLYDAMFAQGFRCLVEERRGLRLDPDPLRALTDGARHFVEFCQADAARFQLLFQHSLPGFTPSDASLAISAEALLYLQSWLDSAGLNDPAAVDLLRALMVGLAGEQIANEPGGDRWTSFLDDVIEIFVDVMRRRSASTPTTPTARRRSRRG